MNIDILEIFSLANIVFCLLGTIIGIIFGCIPGLNAAMGIVLVLPFTYGMTPVQSFAILLGIGAGGGMGGAISACLINTPGTGAAAATLLDGYPLAQKGYASQAISAATIGSVFGGLFSAVVLIFLAPQLAQIALEFGPAEYFAVGLLGLSIVSTLSSGTVLKGLLCALLGLMISFIGMDPITGFMRYTFGNVNLYSGIGTGGSLLGMFALAEVYTKLEESKKESHTQTIKLKNNKIMSIKDIKANVGNLFRSSAIGTVVGIIPATGVGVAAWMSYSVAKKRSPRGKDFGTGVYDGIIAPEAANSAVMGGAMVPLLTLGIPGDVATAVLLGALMIHGLQPGAKLFIEHGDVVTGIYVMLILANIFLLLLGLFCVKYFAQVLRIPTRILLPIVMLLCMVGSFAMKNNTFEIVIALVFGAMAYIFRKVNLPMPPILLGILLVPIIESNFRRAIAVSETGLGIFVTRPICAAFLLVSLLCFFQPIIKSTIAFVKERRQGGLK